MWELVLDIVVYGEPVPKSRPRAYKAGKHIKMYTPEKVRKYERYVGGQVWAELKEHRRPVIDAGPVRFEAEVYHRRPQRLMRRKDPDGPIKLAHKPDVDNVLKSLMDACNKAPLWTDDAQVCSVAVEQFRCAKDGEPRVHMKIYRWQEQSSEDV